MAAVARVGAERIGFINFQKPQGEEQKDVGPDFSPDLNKIISSYGKYFCEHIGGAELILNIPVMQGVGRFFSMSEQSQITFNPPEDLHRITQIFRGVFEKKPFIAVYVKEYAKEEISAEDLKQLPEDFEGSHQVKGRHWEVAIKSLDGHRSMKNWIRLNGEKRDCFITEMPIKQFGKIICGEKKVPDYFGLVAERA